jgi:hypothetical protein
VVGARAGYHDDRAHVTVEDGAEVDVRLDLDRDDGAPPDVLGGITLVLPEGRIVIRVDGEMLDASGPLSLPIGPHAVDAEADDRAPWSGEVSVTNGTNITLVLPLVWTPDARRERLAAAESMRTGGIATATIGAAFLVTGIVLLAWNEPEITATDGRIRALDAEFRAMGCDVGGLTMRCEEIRDESGPLTTRQNEENVIRGVSIASTLLGAALGGIGLGLTLAAPSEEDVDRAAHAELRLGPGTLELRGAF